MLKESPPLAWISDEMSRLAEVEFKFGQKLPPSHTVSSLAQLMQKACIPREHLLSPSLIRKFDPENVECGLSHLRPDNFRFFLLWISSFREIETQLKNSTRLNPSSKRFPKISSKNFGPQFGRRSQRPSKVHLLAVN